MLLTDLPRELIHIIFKYKTFLDEPKLDAKYIINLAKMIKLLTPGGISYWDYVDDIIISYQKTKQATLSFYNDPKSRIPNLKKLAPEFMKYNCYISIEPDVGKHGDLVIVFDGEHIMMFYTEICVVVWDVRLDDNNDYVFELYMITGVDVTDDTGEYDQTIEVFPKFKYVFDKDSAPGDIVDFLVNSSNIIYNILEECSVKTGFFECCEKLIDFRDPTKYEDLNFGELKLSDYLIQVVKDICNDKQN